MGKVTKMKRLLICVLLVMCTLLCLCGCEDTSENYISGTSFELDEIELEGEFERYENKSNGIIIEYPKQYERLGNLDIDGRISFEGDGVVLAVYAPDEDNNDVLTVEEYIEEVLNIVLDERDGVMTYGKSNGYRYFIYNNDGTVESNFIVKGIDAFYRFSYTCPEEDFDEEDEVYQYIMSSIRVNDGEYNKLTSMYSRYTVLLEYVTSMEYITDANYANHCINTYELSGLAKDKNDARTTLEKIKKELSEIIVYEREEESEFDDMWEEIVEEAEKITELCDEALGYIKSGDMEKTQSIVRAEFDYELSELCEKYLSVLGAEISEY